MKNIRLRKMILSSVFCVLIAACSWISFPFPVTGIPITLQTLAIFLCLIVCGGKWGCASIGLYIIIGMIGVPVFSGFKGGIGVLAGPTGGYIIGFIFTGLLYMICEMVFKNLKLPVKIIVLFSGLLLCYTFGTVWFTLVYSKNTGNIGFGTAITYCVLPYIIPDIIKLGVAVSLSIPLNKLKDKIIDTK